jgi:hypothetical protein
MSFSHIGLGLFICLLSWHFGLSMELPLIAWLGSGLAVLAGARLLTVERPTAGLIFVLFATGALTGNQVLENWAVEDSWPQDNGFGAGVLISLLLYLLWRYASRDPAESQQIIGRDSQSIIVWGLLSLLMISPADATLVTAFGSTAPLLTLTGIVLACLIMLADHAGNRLLQRLALLAPVLVLLPLMFTGLNYGQGPVIAALGNIMPRGGDYTPTGFSPYQTLRSSVFLRPSNDPVMRIRSEAIPGRYLVGNRLSILNSELLWLPSERPVRSWGSLDAELLTSDEWRYPVANHQYAGQRQERLQMSITSLQGDDYLFVPPDVSAITGRFGSISRNAADVLTPNYERGNDPRWQVESGGNLQPDSVNPDNLLLPGFWDDQLQAHSESLAADNRQATADRISAYFLARDYALQTDFDPDQPFHDFFLNERAGYCFWFASATTLALRANGIPSRLVGGYLLNEQLADDLWLVRERDAHSWVEWQDEQGYWHTMDPTPGSITAFFGGYQSSPVSQWYHRLAGQWQALIDRILENQLAATAITWGGLLILVFLFAREYRRLQKRREAYTDLGLRWQKLWQRFLKVTALPSQPQWTATTYANNLPTSWNPQWQASVRQFLQHYQQWRFAENQQDSLQQAEQALTQLKRQN